ncbi:hypothetical protein [Yersinia frederiksenii]|uniref:hypothetical protein n=1 Tax=Yersinia frederiksenii TaxID=29484 RepID=UPI0005E98127|nr:hypothetical protein [Yersinia frederiksenii]CQH58841.1 Uncharacterised protein [Yersinia frederiksenii]
MGWPIPEIPEQSVLPPPRYSLWIITLVIMLIIGAGAALFIGRYSTYIPILLYGVLPALLLWFCIFGVILNRYEQSCASAFAWHEESQKTKAQWQQWSRKQLAVMGNVLLTPEIDGIGSILGEQAKIPMYPQKARRLSGDKQTLPSRLNDIDDKLESQSSGYRHYLHTVYVLHSSALHRETIQSAVFGQWDLLPEFVSSIEEINVLNIESEIEGVILILCLQNWSNNTSQKFSELISAQLISSPEFIKEHGYLVLAGLGRLMPLALGKLSDDLNMLFDYNQLNFNELEHVWLSGDAENTAVNIALYANSHNWILPKKKPVHYIDLTFGPPGELILGLSLSMMVEAARKTSQNQLIIYQKPQSSGSMCLITKELFS